VKYLVREVGGSMALLGRIYFNAVFGALGGLLGWLLFGVFGTKNPGTEVVVRLGLTNITHEDVNALLGGLIIGGVIGYFVVSVEAIRDRSLVRFSRLASYGVLLGAVGGALGMLVGDRLDMQIREWFGYNPLTAILARGIGWMLLGTAIGMSE